MSKKILVIEDNPEMRENTAEILMLSGYDVITAGDGKQGVDMARSQQPDLIICDIMMPVLDGYGVILLLSNQEETASIPFIFLTAKAERSDFRKGMDMGADDYLTKPYTEEELLSAVQSRMRKSDSLRQEFTRTIDGLNQFIRTARDFEELRKLPENREIKKFRKKAILYSEGQFPNTLFFIQSGKVKTFRTNADGKEFVTGLYKEGDFFGYLSLLTEGPYTDSAVSLTDAEVCFIPKEEFQDLLFSNAGVSRKFIELLTDNIREKEEQLLNLAYNSVRKRVADALVTLYNRYHKEDEKTFRISLPREDLASIVGTAKETAIRTLSDFKEEGLLDIQGASITILNLEKLVNMKN